jgi:hypothetical protein
VIQDQVGDDLGLLNIRDVGSVRDDDKLGSGNSLRDLS